jgi:hypothetical protein
MSQELVIKYSYSQVPTIKQFSQSDKFIRGLMGPFGSGKSSGCVIELIKRSMAQLPGPDGVRRTRWAIIRNTYQQLKDTSLKTFHQWLPPIHFGEWRSTDHTYLITKFPGAEIEVLFRALDRPDQVDNLLSLELTGAWVNEAREIPWTIIQALQGRVGRYPAAREGGPTWFGIFMDTNPPDNDSWWYKLFEETKPENSEIFKQPSGLSPEAENKSNLPIGYYENLASGMDSEANKVYVLGQYGFVIDGKPVYPEYNDNLHCQEFEFSKSQPILRGWDFGLTPSCVFTQITPSGRWLVRKELTSEHMGADKFSDEVIMFSNQVFPGFKFTDYGDPAGQQESQTDEKTCFQILQAKGIQISSGEQTPTIRIESVKKQLSTLKEGKPALIIHPDCKMLRKGFQGGYQFRRLQTSKERYVDKPDKNQYSHVHDALQYVGTRLFGDNLTTSQWSKEPLKVNTSWVV